MKKLITLLALGMSFHAMALSKIDLAKFYADQLLEEFDQKLDQKTLINDGQSMIQTEVYARLLSARRYIESIPSTPQKIYFPLLVNTQLMQQVVDEINADAELIHEDIMQGLKNDQVIFPSITSAGEITGNQFPKGFWAITYDDGPKGGNTELILDHLLRSGVKATFFMVMEQVKKFPESATAVLDFGFELALHSYTHQNLSKATAEVLEYEVTQSLKEIQQTLDRPVTYFRLPYGAGRKMEIVRQKLADNHLIHVFWNVDSLDWNDKDPKSVFARVQKQMKLLKAGGVILFHDIHKQTVTATELVLDYFHQEGLQTCFLAEFTDYANGLEQGCVK